MTVMEKSKENINQLLYDKVYGSEMTIKEICRQGNFSYLGLMNWIYNRRKIRHYQLVRLCNVFSCHPLELGITPRTSTVKVWK